MNDKTAKTLPVTAFDPVSPETQANQSPVSSDKPNLFFVAVLGVAVVALIGVFFALPDWVDSSEAPVAVVVTEPVSRPPSNEVQSSSMPTPSERSPFSEAQLARERRAAQEILQIVLEAQENLQALGVELWAASQYETAIEEALSGDSAYRERDFIAATQIYQSVADQLLAIEQQLPNEISQRLETLIAAIEQGDEIAATALASDLELMAPDRADVASALDRAKHISVINALVAEADQYTESADPKGALQSLQQASDLDPEHQRVAGLLQNAKQAVNDFNFAQAMSQGFDALEQASFENARNAFRRAAALKPGSESPALALRELDTAETIA
ncbi:MAG: hypothetical protein ACO3NE_14010, partial [Alphaproteobacteria bacterium]